MPSTLMYRVPTLQETGSRPHLKLKQTSGLLPCLMLIALLLSALWPASSWATIYKITATHDNDNPGDGVCSIREAIIAANLNAVYNECPEGGVGNSDNIRLLADRTYTLTEELQIGINPNTPGERFNIRGGEQGTVVELAGSRFASVFDDNVLSIGALTIRNGDGSGNVATTVFDDSGTADTSDDVALVDNSANDGFGGAFYVEGSLELSDVKLEDNTAATAGGAIYLRSDNPSIASSVSLEMLTATGNEATAGNGGLLAIDPATDGAFLTFSKGLVSENTAGGTGGAFSIDGANILFVFENLTIALNEAAGGAGAIDMAGGQNMTGNALTITENTSTTGAVSIADGTSTSLINTIIAGNVGGDCAGAGFDNDATVEDLVLLYGQVGVDALAAACGSSAAETSNVQSGLTVAQTITDVDSTLLSGVDPCPTAGTCGPGDFGGDFPTYLPRGNSPNTVIDLGAPRTDANCLATDVRQAPRLVDDCDIGAAEYQVAVAERDEATIVQGNSVLIDVAENDLGDTSLDCTRVAGFILADSSTWSNCLEIIIKPSRPGASATPRVDADGYVRVRYSPGGIYHGIDRFAYRINKDAFDRTIDDQDVEEFVSIQSEPAYGLLLKEDITDEEGGSMSWMMLACMFIGALFRKRKVRNDRSVGFRSVVALFILFSAQAQAADITVNLRDDIRRGAAVADYSGDQSRRGDGFCSLREAIDSARDRTVNLEGACANGAIGRDIISLPRGCITLKPVDGAAPEETGSLRISGSVMTIKGKGPHTETVLSVGDVLPLDICDPASPNFTEGTIILADKEAVLGGANPHRLITADSALTLEGVTLAYGDAGNSDGGAISSTSTLTVNETEFVANTASRGGAVFLAAAEQDVVIRNSYFRDNISTATTPGGGGGGAMASVAQALDLELKAVTFEGNMADQEGGAMDLGSTKRVAMENVTVTGNASANGTGGLDLQDAVRATLSAMTIVNNTAGGSMPGGMDLGNDPDNNRNIRLFNSVYADNLNGGGQAEECSSGTARLSGSSGNLFEEDDINTGYYPDTCLPDNLPVLPDPPRDEFIANGGVWSILDAVLARNVGNLDIYSVPHHGFIVAATVPPLSADAALVLDAGLEKNCLLTDTRGFTRPAGNGCDRGAFEFQSSTAVNDVASNKRRRDRLVVVDVLANDQVDPAGDPAIYPQQCSIDLDPSTVGTIDYTGTHMLNHDDDVSSTPDITVNYWVALASDINTPCTGAGDCPLHVNDPDNPDTSDDCVVVYDSGDIYFTGDVVDELTYIFQDNAGGGSWSSEGTITVDVVNLPPRVKGDRILSLAGKTQIIPVLVNDVDFDGQLDVSTLEIKQEPNYGTVKISGSRIVYEPNSVSAAFDDSFSYGIMDNDGAAGSAFVSIEYKRRDAGGGQLLNGTSGSGHGLFLLILAAGWVRRWRQKY